jgi:hypothetical protein
MDTICAPLLVGLLLYSNESEFLEKIVKENKIHEARALNFTYRYIDDVLSINNSRFAEFLPLIYPPELEIKETILNPYLYTCSLYENPSFIIVSVEIECISTKSWYRNINFLREQIRRILL